MNDLRQFVFNVKLYGELQNLWRCVSLLWIPGLNLNKQSYELLGLRRDIEGAIDRVHTLTSVFPSGAALMQYLELENTRKKTEEFTKVLNKHIATLGYSCRVMCDGGPFQRYMTGSRAQNITINECLLDLNQRFILEKDTPIEDLAVWMVLALGPDILNSGVTGPDWERVEGKRLLVFSYILEDLLRCCKKYPGGAKIKNMADLEALFSLSIPGVKFTQIAKYNTNITVNGCQINLT